jgi:chemotaxis family two-component system response regulator Rcp1
VSVPADGYAAFLYAGAIATLALEHAGRDRRSQGEVMIEQGGPRLVEILLVEDNPSDVLLTQIAMRECKIANRLDIATDGEAALAFLRRQEQYQNVRGPDLVLLDLNLPRMDGRELLREIKSDPRLRMIPVVVLTTSDSETDVIRSYDLHANAYITKPMDMEQFIRVVRGIDEFWFGIVRLPRRPEVAR